MRPSRTPNLGLIVSRIMETYTGESQDYDMDGSGECGSLIRELWDGVRNRIVQEYGFANMCHFLAVVEKRTTSKWAYYAGLR